jgi:hypothetical protein
MGDNGGYAELVELTERIRILAEQLKAEREEEERRDGRRRG